ncbi:MAG TPA: DNA cytosine methyltransferase [Candidatus Paceibacterota bacterium]|nr:DNA cytosine methyltransferase [Candidatus Paceibacterota bacterium]
MRTPYTTIDLFAGIGGIRKGFEAAGFSTLYAADNDAYCKATYDLNFAKKGAPLALQDVAAIDRASLPDFDALLAGFPCQSFSVAGNKKGFEDTGRGDLFFELMKIVEEREEEKKPRVVFLENVKNLLTHDHGRTFVIINERLANAGYHVRFSPLSSADYGDVPQARERVYIVGFKDKAAHDAFEFPEKLPRKKTILDVLEDGVDEKYYYREGWLYDRIKNQGMKPGRVYQWRRVHLREIKSGICCTLTANMGMGGHNVPLVCDSKGLRRLTPRECLRLQGFPDTFKIPETIPESRLYKQVGNSVTVSVIERIAKNIKKALDAAEKAAEVETYGRRIHKGKAERDHVAHKVAAHVA